MIAAAVLLLAILLGYRSAAKPLRAVENGIYLLKAQDFGSRLRKTGQADADHVIELFNRLMDSLKKERLKNLEQDCFLAQLLQVSPMGIAICDFDGNIVQTNPAFDKIISPDFLAELQNLKSGQTEVVRQGSSQIFRCSRLSFMDSGFHRPFFIVERITEEISHAERDVFKKIVRTIGHEVNNTLGSVSSVLETLSDIHAAEPAVGAAIGSCRDSCAKLVSFVKAYADIVKLPDPVLADVNLAGELGTMMPVLKGLAPDNVTVELAVEGVGDIRADMMLIGRAVINIVKNAVESIGARPDGRITLHVNGSRLHITDNGPGITDEVARSLFTPFFSTKCADRGLGLMLVADILRAHGARFSLSTDHVTGLTTFVIEFQPAV